MILINSKRAVAWQVIGSNRLPKMLMHGVGPTITITCYNSDLIEVKAFFFFFFFYVRAYLGINSKKLITNGKDHIETADKYTPR